MIRARIIQKINDADADNHQNIKFLCQVGDEGAEEIIAYTEICQLIEEQDRADATEKLHTYQKIIDHHGPLNPSDYSTNPIFIMSRSSGRMDLRHGNLFLESRVMTQ